MREVPLWSICQPRGHVDMGMGVQGEESRVDKMTCNLHCGGTSLTKTLTESRARGGVNVHAATPVLGWLKSLRVRALERIGRLRGP